MNYCPICEILSSLSCGKGEANVCAVVLCCGTSDSKVVVTGDAATEQQLCFSGLLQNDFPDLRLLRK